MQQLTITVYEPDSTDVWYTFTGTQEEINNEIDLLDPTVEYSVESTCSICHINAVEDDCAGMCSLCYEEA